MGPIIAQGNAINILVFSRRLLAVVFFLDLLNMSFFINQCIKKYLLNIPLYFLLQKCLIFVCTVFFPVITAV